MQVIRKWIFGKCNDIPCKCVSNVHTWISILYYEWRMAVGWFCSPFVWLAIPHISSPYEWNFFLKIITLNWMQDESHTHTRSLHASVAESFNYGRYFSFTFLCCRRSWIEIVIFDSWARSLGIWICFSLFISNHIATHNFLFSRTDLCAMCIRRLLSILFFGTFVHKFLCGTNSTFKLQRKVELSLLIASYL